MQLAFTICSNNYLAHAKTLGDSFLEFHPNVRFIIGLVDKYDLEFDYSFFSAFEIILVEEIAVPNFEELNEKYNITELNTAVKPSYLHHIFKKYNAKKILYIDPDILVTSSFDEVFDALDSKNIVITPHMCSPVDDEFGPNDYDVLGGGVYNLGFIGLSDYDQVKGFIDWWHNRVVKYGYGNQRKGMFFDQLWIQYVPCFFDNYYILKHLGYNMANWNLHEREISAQDNVNFIINDDYTLRFFHFSSYKFEKPDTICRYQTRYDFNSRPDLVPLFNKYATKLKENKVDQISKLNVFYYPNLHQLRAVEKKKTTTLEIIYRMKKAIKILIKGRI
ncbi:hypothetical protein [Flavobacterium sp. K5-23]|uniref:hypothetical protein n=1 Tax=Flavobacterium sp. K5-23 TaxID=2746225 RepID=UPI00200D84F7|nr:hypothetical protein [Flavobacterium sp. K5-23]UQD56146.1 glycosyl transferase [Flavobacterium sp. K5-23]